MILACLVPMPSGRLADHAAVLAIPRKAPRARLLRICVAGMESPALLAAGLIRPRPVAGYHAVSHLDRAGVLTTIYRIVPLNDFGRIYYSAAAFWKAEPMYGWNPTVPQHIPGTNTLDGEEFVLDLPNLNPPHFHLVFLPLALLPVEAAFVLWTLLGLACVGSAGRMTLRETGAHWTPRVRSWPGSCCSARP